MLKMITMKITFKSKYPTSTSSLLKSDIKVCDQEINRYFPFLRAAKQEDLYYNEDSDSDTEEEYFDDEADADITLVPSDLDNDEKMKKLGMFVSLD